MNKLISVILLLTIALSARAATEQEAAGRVRYKGGPAFIYRIYLTA